MGTERIAYTREGGGSHTIIAVPGLPGSVRDFRWLAPALHGRFELIRIELPGYGQSSRAGYRGMTIEERADCIVLLAKELGLERVTLLSHSAGGTLIAEVARRHPDLTRQCVFIASNGPVPHYPVRVYRALSNVFALGVGRRLMRPILRRGYRMAGFPGHLSDDERLFTTLDAAMASFDLHAENVRNIECPCMTAWAEDDHLIPAPIFEALDDALPQGPRLRFSEGGHNIQKTQAVEIANAIDEFAKQ